LCQKCFDDNLIGVWSIKAAINNDTNEIIYYPIDVYNQELEFEIDNNFSNNCNMHGKYSIDDKFIEIYSVIFTEMYCQSMEFMEWEELLANNFYGKCEYTIDNSELYIVTRNEIAFILTKKV
jgi:heat shock protein HslJ